MPGIFLYLLMVFQGPGATVHALISFDFFYHDISIAGLKLILDLLGSSFLCHVLLLY
jgi:hypothetical protein